MTTYRINGMGCEGCASTVKERLSKVEGVKEVAVDFAGSKATIEMTKEVPLSALQKALEGTSYSITK
ncbi:Cu2+-exporting ATPase [Capnocytophaga haemolytica]|uniref:ATPase P n=1 Tax=Capnocytophaga haemolytica TaxID=45243 RepID=A0AAX2GWD1_9FLAO|nr:heavy metal-associated domain-containing protein [Capnocytophaga haemolytica]AMD85209.1 ATPase P [Capnocytophaga haemolytica]SFN64559.1 Cu2+-exporting ATPase [Capnocytophaga haemolytica]SNV04185.1 Copper-exporting P-type ATPase A [Capnocytophaga haemolytica]